MQTNEQTLIKREEIQLVVFKVGSEEYAAPILDVKEIIKLSKLTPIPHAPEFIAGIINLRGKIIVVIDLAKRLALKKEPTWTHLVILSVGEHLLGVTVEGVSQVLRVDKAKIKDPPQLIAKKIHTDYLNGVVVLEDRLIIILNIKQLFSEEELAHIQELTQEATKDKPSEPIKQTKKNKQQTTTKPNQKREKLISEGKVRKRKR